MALISNATMMDYGSMTFLRSRRWPDVVCTRVDPLAGDPMPEYWHGLP